MIENYEELINDAYNKHVSGELESAKAVYEKLLKINPDDLDVINLYAQLNFALKNYNLALELFSKVYNKTELDDVKINIVKVYLAQNEFVKALEEIQTIHDENVASLRLKAKIFVNLHDYDSAIKSYLKILNTDQKTLNDIINIAFAYTQKKDYENSLKYSLEAYKQAPDDYDICCNIANAYSHLEDKENQLKYLLEAANIKPNIDLFYNIGVIYRQLGNDEEALEYFKAIIEADSNNKFAYLNIAKIYQQHDKHVSIQIYSELAEKYPEDTMILTQLYIMCSEIMQYDLCYETALKLIKASPNDSFSYSIAAESLYKLGKYEEAIEMYQKAKEYSDENEYYDTEIASIYSILNRSQEAIEVFKTKIPNLMDSTTYGMIQFRNKNLEEGRYAMHKHLIYVQNEEDMDKRALNFFYKLKLDKKYGIDEAGFRTFKTRKSVKEQDRIKYYLTKDLYENSPKNKKILTYNAHGMGDLIMFSRYIKILERYTDNITLQSPKSIFKMLKYNFPKCTVVTNDDIIDISKFDYTSGFFTLICNLKETSLNNIPYSDKYLDVEEDLVKEKAQMDIMKTKKKKVGIFWMGNPVIMPQRSIKLEKLRPFFDISNLQIYSFQISNYDYESGDLKKDLPLIDLAPYIKDYSDTGAFLKNIDLLITIDSSIANLAGAMGIKTYLLLPFESEWRWFYDTEKTPWYDSVKIFKQKVPYEWDEVVERVKNELEI